MKDSLRPAVLSFVVALSLEIKISNNNKIVWDLLNCVCMYYCLSSVLSWYPSPRQCVYVSLSVPLSSAGTPALVSVCMYHCLSLCPQLVPQPSSVHALNILRGLFRDNKLGELMTPYVTEGLKIAIRGFSVQYWPVGYPMHMYMYLYMYMYV